MEPNDLNMIIQKSPQHMTVFNQNNHNNNQRNNQNDNDMENPSNNSIRVAHIRRK